MIDTERPVFAASLQGMFEMFREPLSDFLAESYWTGLKQWPLEVVVTVIGQTILDWKWCPKLAELRELVQERDEYVRMRRPALEPGRPDESLPKNPMVTECMAYWKSIQKSGIVPEDHLKWLKRMHRRYPHAGWEDAIGQYEADLARRGVKA